VGKEFRAKYYICENAHLINMGDNIANLYFKSKKISTLILAATAIICSRVLFFFFNDPEGPNLLIVVGLALGVFLLSYSVYVFGPLKMKGIKRLSVVICIQLLSVVGLYLCMK